ncbi:MAG: methionyl-tRNA formyltransferase [Planctomycetes bacterium]|nr:methionyl-tRNA formyltransferase [Planctomycetota bacterium]
MDIIRQPMEVIGKDRLRIVFMGTPDFAVPSLEAVAAAGHDLVLAVTQPDRPRGRKGAPQPPPVKNAALAKGIPVLQPESVNSDNTIDNLVGLKPDVIVVAAFGRVFSKRVIETAAIACVNVHASLLPKYRGAAPIPAAILNGDEVTGVTIQRMVRKLDAGDIIRQRSMAIAPDETAGELTGRLARLGAELLVEALKDLATGTAAFEFQDDSQATFAPMLQKSDGKIDWRRSADEIARHVRAMTPWPGAFTFARRDGRPLRITLKKATSREAPAEGEPGEVVEVSGGGFTVSAGKDAVLVSELQPAGKKHMTASEFIRGYRLQTGARLAEA